MALHIRSLSTPHRFRTKRSLGKGRDQRSVAHQARPQAIWTDPQNHGKACIVLQGDASYSRNVLLAMHDAFVTTLELNPKWGGGGGRGRSNVQVQSLQAPQRSKRKPCIAERCKKQQPTGNIVLIYQGFPRVSACCYAPALTARKDTSTGVVPVLWGGNPSFLLFFS